MKLKTGALLKNLFASAIAALTLISAPGTFAAVGESTYYSASLKFSEITVVNKDGKTVTYDVPVKVAAVASFDSKFEKIEFGLESRCPKPFLGVTATEVKVEATNIRTTQATRDADGEYTIGRAAKINDAILTIPAGSGVYGNCDGSTKTLGDLAIYAKDKTTIRYESK